MTGVGQALSSVPDATAEAMAEYLGIQLPSERYLLWIAKQCCVEALPAGWTEFKDDDENTFYFNADTQESTYSNPLDETFLFLIEKERKKHADELAAAVAVAAGVGEGPAATTSAPATRPKRGRRGAGAGGADGAPPPVAAPPPASQPAAAAATAAAAKADPVAVRGMAEYLGIDVSPPPPHTHTHLPTHTPCMPATGGECALFFVAVASPRQTAQPDGESQMLGIAAMALVEPLPPEWTEYDDGAGDVTPAAQPSHTTLRRTFTSRLWPVFVNVVGLATRLCPALSRCAQTSAVCRQQVLPQHHERRDDVRPPTGRQMGRADRRGPGEGSGD